jgi:tetratricopeptide (TPR) repeat protein
MVHVSATALAVLALWGGQAVAAELSGVVREKDIEHGRSLPGVVVEAPGAGLARTDGEGKFTLHFPDRQVGDTVTVRVSHPGLVVVNDLDLDAVLLRVPGAPALRVLLGEPQKKEALARELYLRRIVEAVDVSHRRALVALRAERIAAESHELRAEVIETEHRLLRAAAPTLAAEVANENVPGSVEVRGEALRLFSAGNVHEAASKLDKIGLGNVRGEVEVLEEKAAAALHALGVQHTEERRFVRAGEALAQALAIRRGLVLRNPDRLPDLAATMQALAESYLQQLRNEEARDLLKEALAIRQRLVEPSWGGWDERATDVAGTLGPLGKTYRSLGRLQDAQSAWDEAARLYPYWADREPEVYAGRLAEVLIDLGNLETERDQLVPARKAFQEALAISQDLLSRKHPSGRFFLPGVLRGLAALDLAAGDGDKSRKQLEEALAIAWHAAAGEPDTWLAIEASVLEDLGNLESRLHRTSQAQRWLDQALGIYRRLARQAPDRFAPALASTLNRLGRVHTEGHKPAEARRALREALAIHRRLAHQHPAAYAGRVAETLADLAVLDGKP